MTVHLSVCQYHSLLAQHLLLLWALFFSTFFLSTVAMFYKDRLACLARFWQMIKNCHIQSLNTVYSVIINIWILLFFAGGFWYGIAKTSKYSTFYTYFSLHRNFFYGKKLNALCILVGSVTSLWPGLSIGRLVGWSVCHKLLIGR